MLIKHKKWGFPGHVDFNHDIPKAIWDHETLKTFTLRYSFAEVIKITKATKKELEQIFPFQKEMFWEYVEKKKGRV